MEPQLIKDCLSEVLMERSSVDSDVHRDHHHFLSEHIPLLRDYLEYQNEEMKARQLKRDRWSKAWEAAMGTTVVAVVGAGISILAWIGHVVIQAVIQIINTPPTS